MLTLILVLVAFLLGVKHSYDANHLVDTEHVFWQDWSEFTITRYVELVDSFYFHVTRSRFAIASASPTLTTNM